MRILHISDTHSYHYPVDEMPDADILIHSGDATIKSKMEELIRFAKWLTDVCAKYPHVIYVPGNHDYSFNGIPKDEADHANALRKDWLKINVYKTNLHIVTHGMIELCNLKIFCSSYTKRVGLGRWYYYIDGAEALALWETVPACDVLVTHGPAYGIMDEVALDRVSGRDIHQGCCGIRSYLESYPPKLHLFGHIHETYGCKPGYTIKGFNSPLAQTYFVNSSIRDENYNIMNTPILITMTAHPSGFTVDSLMNKGNTNELC